MNTNRKMQRLLDAALIVACAITAVRLTNRPAAAVAQYVTPIRLGGTLSLPGLNWAKSARTLVVLVKPGCPACEQSVGLYRQLARVATSGAGTRIVFVSTEPALDVARWLKASDIASPPPLEIDAYHLGFVFEPTILLVNARGTITDQMERRLDAGESQRLIARAQGRGEPISNAVSFTEIEESDFDARAAVASGGIILDIQQRQQYQTLHLSGAINIPSDELSSRAASELNEGGLITLDCVHVDVAQCRSAADLLHNERHAVALVVHH